MAAPLRGFRLRRPGSAQKFGAAAGSLRGLLRKGCRLLQLPLAGSRLCLYEDGTELSEAFFRTLPPQTELVLLRPGESWPGCCGDVERFLAALCSRTDAVVEAARRLLEDERAPHRQRLLADLIHNLSGDSAAERRDEDGKWFEGLESRFKNKSSYMRYSCESRIRSYMKEVSNFISNVHPAARDAYKRILDLMSDKLRSVKYNGSYFDRTEEEAAMRLCTKEGWFSCQGPFDSDDCPCKHSINPYTNRESRILFSTWNLDHIAFFLEALVLSMHWEVIIQLCLSARFHSPQGANGVRNRNPSLTSRTLRRAMSLRSRHTALSVSSWEAMAVGSSGLWLCP
uniref:DNA fragmentation factor subunit beta n=1 Tax=Pavo cristatus TaxID=9049 RepID=A0A8C9L766_PAVCR